MVKVKSSRGGFVDVEIKGINEVVNYLRFKGIQVSSEAEIGLIQAGNFVQQEVQESIIGNRVENKSVATGLLGNSIVARPIGKGLTGMIVFTEKHNYPGTNTDTQKIAELMEFSPNIVGGPRRHFANTKSRTKDKVVKILKNQLRRI